MRKTATSELANPKLGGMKQDVFVLLHPRRTRRGSNPLINRYSIFTTKRRDFSRIMSFDSFPDYRSANQAEGGQMPFADRGGSAGFGVAQTPTVREEGTRRSRLHIGDKLALTLRSYRRSILGTVFQFHRKTGTSSYPYTPCFCMACMTRVFTPFPPQVAAVEKS